MNPAQPEAPALHETPKEDAGRKREATLKALAAMQGVALHRLADGRWIAHRWNLSRELADHEVEAWLQRVGGPTA